MIQEERIDGTTILPTHWSLLSEIDQHDYTCLRNILSSPNSKSQRNKRIETFRESINAIKSYVVRNDENDWMRSVVCGIGWLPNGLAINTHQLCILFKKCKSSINGSLQKIGYGTTLERTSTSNSIIKAFPIIKTCQWELRQWTIRIPFEYRSASAPISPVLPLVTPLIHLNSSSSSHIILPDLNADVQVGDKTESRKNFDIDDNIFDTQSNEIARSQLSFESQLWNFPTFFGAYEIE